jgi:hypothetical protein
VKCGYGKKWVVVGCETCEAECGGCDVQGCVDPRGCERKPPESTAQVYGEWDGGNSPIYNDRRREFNLMEEGKITEIEVGTTFWYMCSDRKYKTFEFATFFQRSKNRHLFLNCYSCYLFNPPISAALEQFKDISAVGEKQSRNNTFKYIVMECKNDPTGGSPYWDPNYDHLISPFPECITLPSKYFIFFIFMLLIYWKR